MTGCRDAISAKNWPALRSLVQRIAAKAKRVAEIAGMAADQAKEPQRKWVISTAVKRLNNGELSLNVMLPHKKSKYIECTVTVYHLIELLVC